MTTEQSFLKDVEKHELNIIRDDGVNRHMRFKQPSCTSMYFDLITWPGHLCFTGDMGTYVFQRTHDMFEFFRTDREYNKSRGRQLGINTGYWAEKLIAVDCNGGRSKGGAMEFSKERFSQVINEYRLGWIKDAFQNNSLPKDKRRELWEAVQEEVLDHLDDGEYAAYQRANDFSWSVDPYSGIHFNYRFTDLFEHRFEDYTFHFLWCCYALAWGIEKYDETKKEAINATAST